MWTLKTLQGEFDPYCDCPWLENIKGENKDAKFVEIINKIAVENKPFMDIASSYTMGLASYIVKMNPKIPCLVTDIDQQEIKYLRRYVSELLPEYNISLASFDNFDIPIKDQSLDYITGICGIGSSCGKPENESMKNNSPVFPDNEKVIHEVYRILKPGGYFITEERNMEFEYDLRKIYDDYNEHGKLFGIYTYDEIQAVCELLIEYPWRDNFISAGFEIEVEKKYYERYSINGIKEFLYNFTSRHGIREWTNEEIVLNSTPNDKNKAEDIGMDFYNVETFYILRKPN